MAVSFMVKGLEEYQKDIETLLAKYPDETKARMRKIGRQFTKDYNDLIPGSYQNGKNPIPKKWKVVVDERLHETNQVYITNKAPHFHLVENGHRKWINGVDTGGYVPGKHYMEKVAHEYEDKFPEEIKALLDEMLRGKDL